MSLWQLRRLGGSTVAGVILSPILLMVLITGCAHHAVEQAESPEALLNYACRPGSTVDTVQGAVMMKAQSKEASGSFPASIKAHYPDQLKVEATNLLGATQAVVTVQGRTYTVERATKFGMKKQEQGTDSWGGIPLRWAPDLFLGRIPCPQIGRAPGKVDGATLSVTDAGDLKVQVKQSAFSEAETFVYHFRSVEGHPWPESLHWERSGTFSAQVDFKFDSPEDKTLSPRNWEAKSPQGEVKVRWRDRKVTNAAVGQ